jgi:hypothetical protein
LTKFNIFFKLMTILFGGDMRKLPQLLAGMVLISEIQIAGQTTTDEFVELYNPGSQPVNLLNFRLTKKTAAGTESALKSALSGMVPAKGFFLLTSPNAVSSNAADLIYSGNTIANDNTVILYDSNMVVVDKLGLGDAVDKEGSASADPSASKSLERKANIGSTKDSMKVGGLDEFNGNSWDSDNNQSDFVIRDIPQPQNSLSSREPVLPTPTVMAEPTSTPTAIPTATPTNTPTPTLVTSPTNTPIPTLTPPPQDNGWPWISWQLRCQTRYTFMRIMNYAIPIPKTFCSIK